MSKVFPFDVVVCFDENLSQDGLAYGIVFGVELVKAVKGVAVLEKQESKHFDRIKTFESAPPPPWSALTACMSRVSTLRSNAVRFMLSNTSMSV